MTIQIDTRRIHVGWRFILRWPRIVAATKDRHPHGRATVFGLVLEEW
jgi:hypothetical protein